MNAKPPIGLRSLGLESHYRSDERTVVDQFYVPALSVASEYCRAVGYFTSASLEVFSEGLKPFIEHGGSIRLVASPHLDADDVLDIERGYALRDVVERATLRELESLPSDRDAQSLGALGRLVAAGRMEIKLALVAHERQLGIYHEKVGVFRDQFDDMVAMSGSANETRLGLLANFESIEVFKSWEMGDGARAARIADDFERLWEDKTPNLVVLDFPDAARQQLIRLQERLDSDPPIARTSAPTRSAFAIPPGLEPRDYQRAAVHEWLSHRGRGILRMATGTGKTKTAMFAASRIQSVHRDREEPLVVLVVAPLQHLVDQWIDELAVFGVQAVGVYESTDRWQAVVHEQIAAAKLGRRDCVALVATDASFKLPHFQAVLRNLTLPFLFIADEAHNLSSKLYSDLLPVTATYRLALSATPEHWFDDSRMDRLVDYFGPVVYELGLGQAIELGALCHYRYVPRVVELTDTEAYQYAELTHEIGQRLAGGESMEDEESPLGYLLRLRAGVLGHAAGKVPLLKEDVERRSSEWFQLVYCAEGKGPVDPAGEDAIPQIEKVLWMLGRELGLTAHSYVAETSRATRRRLLERFGRGDSLQFLVAMKCLDEGVDIPDARVAYLLASSSNPRQFIQRRGRILRRAPGKDFAEILDYVTVPPQGSEVNLDVERRLMARELKRVAEFAKLSDNYSETLRVLRPLKERYELIDL